MVYEPNPEWFKGPYASQWKRHADNVKALHDELVRRFPVLEHSIRAGLGAESADLVQIPPHEKGEPDLEIFHRYKLFCHIEVSGSASRNVHIPPQPIYIRPDKLDLAAKKEAADEPYFFWMVYWDVKWLVRTPDALPHRQTLVAKNWYGVDEVYCEIPYTAAKPSESLFEWVQGRLAQEQ